MITIHFKGGPKDGESIIPGPDSIVGHWMQFGNARYGFERQEDLGNCLYYRFNGFVVTPDEYRHREVRMFPNMNINMGTFAPGSVVYLGDNNQLRTLSDMDFSVWPNATFSNEQPQPLTLEVLRETRAMMRRFGDNISERFPQVSPTSPLHGLEYEFQLVTEIKGVMQTVYVDLFSEHHLCIGPIKYDDFGRAMQPRENAKVKADIGNIEISTKPYKTYKEAISEAEDLLNSKVVPQLARHLNSFALFLPAPMSIFSQGMQHAFNSCISCLKHWNIDNNTMKAFGNFFSYPYTLKEGITGARIEVKIPYHFTPPEDVSEMPPFESIIIPPDNWRPLVGYYRSGKWHQIRPLR